MFKIFLFFVRFEFEREGRKEGEIASKKEDLSLTLGSVKYLSNRAFHSARYKMERRTAAKASKASSLIFILSVKYSVGVVMAKRRER